MDEEFIKELDVLRTDYRKKMLKQVYALESHWQIFRQRKCSTALDDVYLIAHNLSGTAGTYGYPCVSQLCRALVLYIDDCRRDGLDLCKQTISHRIETLIILSCLESCEPLSSKDELQAYLSLDWKGRTLECGRAAPGL